MACKITTTWCNQETQCFAKVVKNGESFIDPPRSSLYPSYGATYYYDRTTCVLGGGPGGGRLPTTVNWSFRNGQWVWTYNCNGTTLIHKVFNAVRVQPTKIQKICQKYVVCYSAGGECPGGSPNGTPPPGLFDVWGTWNGQADTAGAALGGGTPTTRLPNFPVNLNVDATVSKKNGSGFQGSTTPVGRTESGATADCVAFNNPTRTSEYPMSAPEIDESEGPYFRATN